MFFKEKKPEKVQLYYFPKRPILVFMSNYQEPTNGVIMRNVSGAALLRDFLKFLFYAIRICAHFCR